MTRRLAVGLGALIAAAAPVTVTGDGEVKARTAECQNGTCCPEDKALCVVGNSQIGGYYHKAAGSCISIT